MLGTISAVDAQSTRRARLILALTGGSRELEELRRELEMTVRDLEDDLRHVERTVRARGQRLKVDTARCRDCGFRFARRALHPPGRCPACRGHRIEGPWLRIT
jgi:predicted Zn-ribbon and HTH transcriptional regulator